jgi:L-cysteine:1D-myo-inositol 2-amino-2-deoxy-alpha-D-glucopyranoside ligase
MPRAAARLERWKTAADADGAQGVFDAVRERLDDDLDTPGAIAVVDEAAAGGHDVRSAAALLGVDL